MTRLTCLVTRQPEDGDMSTLEQTSLAPSRCYSEGVVTPAPTAPVAVVFDGDDTLWSTEPLYDRARAAARAEVVRVGLDGDAWERIERRVDVENVQRLGFSTERFPLSCVQAYEQLADFGGVPRDPEVSRRVRSAARIVFDQDPPLVPGAREAIQALRERGAKLALLTKGDHDLQERRVERSGIADLFDVIRIVPEKPASVFREIVALLGVKPKDAWSVGNSIRSDIVPAIESGLRAVWIEAHVWEHERFEGSFRHDRMIAIRDVSDLPEAIDIAVMHKSSHGAAD